ncbi:MAG: amidohydrolase family protein [Longimicrobiales bacterium]|nr:amidohydrolase family protein [Longimicrobiales bacterium]
MLIRKGVLVYCWSIVLTSLVVLPASSLFAQATVIEGGYLFDGIADDVVLNPGILIQNGKFLEVGLQTETSHSLVADTIKLTEDDYIIPGMFDLHAHYAMDLFGEGRVDERVGYPILFLANGVTSTFPGGEVDPVAMKELRLSIEQGHTIGARIFSAGPYFGSWRQGWNSDITEEALFQEVDYWVSQGVHAFKAKGISAVNLQVLIRRAHTYGATVTGHLGSGYRDSVNPRDAIMMGIDRIEHFLGGDAFTSDKSAYESLVEVDIESEDFDSIVDLYLEKRVFFDATLSAYGYYGERDPEVYDYFEDESKYFTPYMQGILRVRPPRVVNEQFEEIYWKKRETIKAFYEAGGAHLITLGTDHPSWGEFLSPFSVHRELLSFVLSGIPESDVIKFATINGAKAIHAGDYLGSIEAGKIADLVILSGNPLEDIRNIRNARMVMKNGQMYDPQKLLRFAEGKIGPSGPEEEVAWKPSGNDH